MSRDQTSGLPRSKPTHLIHPTNPNPDPSDTGCSWGRGNVRTAALVVARKMTSRVGVTFRCLVVLLLQQENEDGLSRPPAPRCPLQRVVTILEEDTGTRAIYRRSVAQTTCIGGKPKDCRTLGSCTGPPTHVCLSREIRTP